MFENGKHLFQPVIDKLNDRRQSKLHESAKSANSACLFIAAYDAHRAFYPDRLLPTQARFWKEIENRFPFVHHNGGAVPTNEFLVASATIFAELGISVDEAYIHRDLAHYLETEMSPLLFPLKLVAPHGKIVHSSNPHSLLLYYNNWETSSTTLHMITNDNTERAELDLSNHYNRGWEVGALLNLSRINNTDSNP